MRYIALGFYICACVCVCFVYLYFILIKNTPQKPIGLRDENKTHDVCVVVVVVPQGIIFNVCKRDRTRVNNFLKE